MKPLLSALLLLELGVTVVSAQTPTKRPAARLQRSSIATALDGNRVFCLIDDAGSLCSDVVEFGARASGPLGPPISTSSFPGSSLRV